MNKCVDAWKGKWMDGRIDGWMDRLKEGRMNVIDGMEGKMDGWKVGWLYG